MYHSLGSSKPNLKRKICKNFLNQPENKKSKEVVKELDEDDFLLSQVNLDEIELKATQVQAQQEQVFIPERFERNNSSDSYTNQVIELRKNKDLKAGEALVLRDKLAQFEKKVKYVEQKLADEKLEKCSREKEKQKREIYFKQQIEKCEEKLQDQLSFKNQELEVANIKIKKLIAENKSLNLKVDSQWDQISTQMFVPVSSVRSSIKLIKPGTPKSNNVKVKTSFYLPTLLSSFSHISTNRHNDLMHKFQYIDKKILNNKKDRFKELSQVFDHSLNTILQQCPGNSSLWIKAQQAKPIGKIFLNIFRKSLYTSNMVMACNSFCEFFTMYLDTFVDCSLHKSNEKLMEAVLKQFEFLLKNVACFPELIARNHDQILLSLFTMCRIKSMEAFVFKVLETILYKLDSKILENFLLFTDLRIPLTLEIAYSCKFVFKNVKASKSFLLLGKHFIQETECSEALEEKSNEINFLMLMKQSYKLGKKLSEAFRKNVFTKIGALIHFMLKEMGVFLNENLVLLEEVESLICCMLQHILKDKNTKNSDLVDFSEIFQFLPRDLINKEPLLLVDFERRKNV